jgi:hypothetical protein
MKTSQTRPPAPFAAPWGGGGGGRGGRAGRVTGQKNDWVRKKKAWNAFRPRLAVHSPALAWLSLVGCFPAEPTPFHQAETIYIVQRAEGRKSSQTRPPAQQRPQEPNPHPFTCRF